MNLGQGTSSITVDWGATGLEGQVQVIETNACAEGVPVQLDVNIHPLPVSTITGPASIPANATGISYAVENRIGYTYAWIVSGGTLVSGDGSSEIIVDWGGEGAGNVQVTATHNACGASAAPENLIINIYGSIRSVQTGDWNDPLTWDCNCVPVNTDNIVVSPGDSVYIVAHTTVQNITIEANGVLYQPDPLNLIVQGDYRVDGDHAGTGGVTADNIYLDGINTQISGTGIISNTSRIRIRNGNKTIIAGTDLTKPNGEVYIHSNIVVRNHGEVTIGYLLWAVNTTSIWINESGAVLNAGGNTGANPVMYRGTLVASAENNTVNLTSGWAQNIPVPSGSAFYHLNVNGGNNKTLQDNIIIYGALDIHSSLLGNNYDINLAGDWNSTGSFDEGSGSLILDGTEDQSISNPNTETFNNLRLQKGSGDLHLDNDIIISGTLQMDGGNIHTADNKLTLGTSLGTTGSLTWNAGSIIGQFERWINATGSDILFPLGTGSWYRPLQVNFNALSGGSLIAEFNASTPGSSGLPITEGGVTVENTFSEGYWKLTTANSLVSSDFNLDVIANGFTSFPIIPDTRLLSRSLGDWTASGNHVAASVNTVSRDNVSMLSGEYALGDSSACTLPLTSSITGSGTVCASAIGESYSVDLHAGSTYNWSVTGGIITGGQGTASILVNWGATGMAGQVEVRESNTCGEGESVLLDVDIHPLPTSTITGRTTAYTGESDVFYHVDELAGYTYAWSISSEGSITAGNGTDSVTVDWNTGGNASLQVIATSTGCGMDADPVSLDVSVSGIILSAQSGDWHQPSTWIGGVVPTQYTSARIQNGDTVTVTAAARVNDLVVESGAVLNSGALDFYIYGDYTLDGIHAGSGNDRIDLRGGEAIIDGSGEFTHTGLVYIISGNKTFAATADLTFASGIRINNNLIVTNLGTLTLGNAVLGQNGGSTWINGENATLETGYYLMNNGVLVASAPGNTIRYASTNWTNNIKVPQNETYYNLEIAGSTNKTLLGNIVVKGDLSISSTLFTNNFNISLEGDWTNTDIFDEGTGQVTFTGSGTQQITNVTGETFYDLIIQKESGQLVLNNNVTVSNNFFLNQGEINNQSNILFLGTSTVNEGTLNYSSGRILGKFRRWLSATGADITFPTGSAGITRTAVVNFTDLTAGTLTASFIDQNPGNVGLPVSEGIDTVSNAFTEGYWVIEKGNGLESSNYDLRLEGAGFSSFTFDANVRIIKRNAGGSPWLLDGTHVAPIGMMAQRTGLNDFSEFALGSSSTCSPPVTSLITGSASNCINDAAIAYSVVNTPGSVYTWTITGGIVASGQGSNTITVNWGAVGMAGQVQVIENNGCADGIPVSLDVDIHPLPTGSITGPASVPASASGVSYSVLNRIGYTYAWTVTGGTLVSGDGTNEITVDWGAEGLGDVQVVATQTACGLSDAAVNLPVNIYGAIRSVQTGNWNNITTWDCGCIPGASDNVVISSVDTVTLDINPTITNLNVESGAVLDNADRILIITGNYTVNGTHTGSGNRDWDRVYLDGVGTTIDGKD